MYTSMRQMLLHASENNYAVMAINCVNFELVKAIIGAAEEEHSPVIVNISPRQFKAHATLELMVPLIKSYAEKTSVPVALNLDHGQAYEDISKAIQLGFSSVMFDGSMLDFTANLKNTRLVVALAHALNRSVEAELGHVGVASDGDNQKFDYYTNVEQALHFVKSTQIDCLAVAIGTAHGSYPKGVTPKLDFDRLRELKKTLQIPLVLHGGSGAGEANISKAVELGINKINVCTDLFNIGRDRIRTVLNEHPGIDYMDLQHEGELAMKDYIRRYMKLIGSSNQYYYETKKSIALD